MASNSYNYLFNVIASFYHAFFFGSDSNNLIIKAIYLILLVVFMIGVIYRINYKIKQLKNKYYVDSIYWETKDTFTIKFRQKEKLKFKAGQFCFLRINKEKLNKTKLYARHPFTISSSPDEETLNFTIKLAGRFTKTISELKKDEEVIIEGPFGIFRIDYEKILSKKEELVFFCRWCWYSSLFKHIKRH